MIGTRGAEGQSGNPARREKAGVARAPCGWIGVRSNSVPIEVKPRLGTGIAYLLADPTIYPRYAQQAEWELSARRAHKRGDPGREVRPLAFALGTEILSKARFW
jgi:hypothetical protein